jgi:hypothetical protein
MNEGHYSDLELAQNIQQFQLKIAEFLIKIKFLPAEQVWFKRLLIENFVRVWGDFLTRDKKRAAMTMLVDFRPMEATGEREIEFQYYSGLKWERSSKTVRLKGLQNVWVLQSALRHILLNLIKERGFVFHGSAVKDLKGRVHILSAKSGGGKSTTAGEMEKIGWKILSDDTVVFLKTKGTWRCCSLGMVEKQFLPSNFESRDFRIYFVEKAKKLEKIKLEKNAQTLEQVIQQVWMLNQTMDNKTYQMVTEFAKEAFLYSLRLPLHPKGLKELINEN